MMADARLLNLPPPGEQAEANITLMNVADDGEP